MQASQAVGKSIIAAVALSLGIASAPLAAQPTLKMASATINDVQHQWLQRFEAEVKARAGGKLQLQIYPASQLGTIPRMVEGLVTGTIESFVTPASFLVGTDPRFQIFDAVGLFQSPEHLNRVLQDPALRARALRIGEGKGIKGIGIFYNSPIIVLSRKPIRSLADFRGQKIRTFATPLQIEPMKALGANAVPMAFSEVLPALQAGNIDGLLAGIPVLTAFKYYDAAKAITEIHPSIVVSVFYVNKRWFDALPADARQTVVDAGAKVDRELYPWTVGAIERANKVWTDNGGQLLRLPPAEQAQLMSQLRSVADRVLGANPEVKAEYGELVKVAERVK
jgi:TRAP-type C4-dicarboxylate transport system substrate-binding protein